MQKIIEKLKVAGPFSRVMDVEIHLAAVGDPQFGYKRDKETMRQVPSLLSEYFHAYSGVIDGDDAIPDEVVPRYTSSMDAAVKLIPDGMFWIAGYGRTRPDEPLAGAAVCKPDDQINPVGEAEGDHLAICLCIAALEARLSQQPQT